MLLHILQNPGCRYLFLTVTLIQNRLDTIQALPGVKKTNIRKKNGDLDVETELDGRDKSER